MDASRVDIPDQGRPLLGVALALITVLLFAVADVLTKYLAERHPVPVVLAVRYIVSLALLVGVLWPRHGAGMWRARHLGLVMLRGLVLSAASLTMGLALRLMPVGETIAILYLSPLAVMALAIPIFGEKVSPFGWALVVLGFLGALLIVRPGGALHPLGVVFALLNATAATVFHLMTRHLSRRESAVTLLFHVSLTGAVVFGALAIPHLGGLSMSGLDVLAAALLGVLATGGHYLFSLSYREAPASLIAPVNYVHLVWAALLGFLVFGHRPEALSIAGMGMIFVAGVGIVTAAHATANRKTKV